MTTPPDIVTIDVEEWFHGHNYLAKVPPETWDDQESRVEANTDRCLEILARRGVRATFFVLGWTASRHPGLVARIAAAGHEIACHSYGHPILFRQTEAEFLDDLARARTALLEAGAPRIEGYRAPSFTLTRPVHGFLARLAAAGFRYDCSLFPIHHPRYGQPDAPRRAFQLETDGTDGLTVVPMTTARILGVNVPFSGGGYLRLLPLGAFRLLRRIARRQGIPTILYLHPWELDTFRPEAGLDAVGRVRSTGGQGSMPGKLEAVLAEGEFATMGEYVRALREGGRLERRVLPLG
jgi:polysaccharide deacetylase family protein (PEP-CTERM system associated)